MRWGSTGQEPGIVAAMPRRLWARYNEMRRNLRIKRPVGGRHFVRRDLQC